MQGSSDLACHIYNLYLSLLYSIVASIVCKQADHPSATLALPTRSGPLETLVIRDSMRIWQGFTKLYQK